MSRRKLLGLFLLATGLAVSSGVVVLFIAAGVVTKPNSPLNEVIATPRWRVWEIVIYSTLLAIGLANIVLGARFLRPGKQGPNTLTLDFTSGNNIYSTNIKAKSS